MGKYGTNLEGFGAFEGGVNADKGAPLVSTSSDGETALLFGPAALREIQAGVANGDFAIPPDAAGDTITEENPLPYWTFTDVNSAGAITCAVVADASSGSGNVLRWSIANNTGTGKSAQISRYIPVASSRDRDRCIDPVAYVSEALGTNARFRITYSYVKQDLTTTGTGATATLASVGNLTAGVGTTNGIPSDAAYVYLIITAETTGTTAALTGDLAEVRLATYPSVLLLAEDSAPSTYAPGIIQQGAGVIYIQPNLGSGSIELVGNVTATGNLTVTGTTQLNGPNSLWVSRIAYTTTQSLLNNTSTKALFNTASATPDIGSYDPKGWFNNANDSIDIGQNGFYCVTANAAFAANATGRREVAIVVNGTNRGSINVSAASAGTTNLSVSTNLYLVSGDQVTLTLVQTSGGALNTANVAGVFPALSVGRIGA